MSARFGRTQKAATLVPLAVLSTAWTASLAGIGTTTTLAADEPASLPDGTSVPTQAIEAPASVTRPGVIAPRVGDGTARQIVSAASTNGIPAAALSAYQRAETVINAADKTCQIPWQLIAAIGRVESDHGRYGGNQLDTDGVATPGIYGVALNGSNSTKAIRDTDAGQFDQDSRWDRAVGPMQFIPGTWSVVGVDADGDGERNPQDINDAALATAVYLCSGDGSLATDAGRRPAIYRYNHSSSYVNLVLDIMHAYMGGDYTAVPNNTASASYFPTREDSTFPATHGPKHHGNPGNPGNDGDDTAATTVAENPGSGPDDDPTSDPTHDPTQDPTQDPTGDPTGSGGDDPAKDPIGDPVKDPGGAVEDPVGTVEDTLTYAQASAKCLAKVGADSVAVLDLLGLSGAYDACMAGYGY